MLTIARTLMGNLKRESLTILLAEQNVGFSLELADRVSALRVLDRLRRGEADRKAHRAPPVDTASVAAAGSTSGRPCAARSAAA